MCHAKCMCRVQWLHPRNTDEHCRHPGFIVHLIWKSLWIGNIRKYFTDVNFLWPSPYPPTHSIVWPHIRSRSNLRNPGQEGKNELGFNSKEEKMSPVKEKCQTEKCPLQHYLAIFRLPYGPVCFLLDGGCYCLFFISAVLYLPAKIPGIIDGCPRMIDQNVLGVSITRGRVGCPGEICRTVSAFKSGLSGFFSTFTWWKVDPFPQTTDSLTVVNLTQHGKMPFWPSYR